jgi:predicted DNA-binding transcriptional regulator AlpA
MSTADAETHRDAPPDERENYPESDTALQLKNRPPPSQTPPERLIPKKEMLSRVGGLSYPTIFEWIRQGKFPPGRDCGGRVCWIESEVTAWIVNRPVRGAK